MHEELNLPSLYWGFLRESKGIPVCQGSNALNSALDRQAIRMACSGSQDQFLSPEMHKPDKRGPSTRGGGIITKQGILCIITIVVIKIKCLDWSFCLKAFGDTLYKNVKGFFVEVFFVFFFCVCGFFL